jgi:hypothetical protein
MEGTQTLMDFFSTTLYFNKEKTSFMKMDLLEYLEPLQETSFFSLLFFSTHSILFK